MAPFLFASGEDLLQVPPHTSEDLVLFYWHLRYALPGRPYERLEFLDLDGLRHD